MNEMVDNKSLELKLHRKMSDLPGCDINLEFVKNFYNELKSLNNEAIDYELKNAQELYKDEQLKNIEEFIKNNMKIIVEINGVRGEMLSSNNESIFDNEKLPNHISMIRFSNEVLMRSGYIPGNVIKVEFDFNRIDIFDFRESPSNRSGNMSQIFIAGNNKSWVEGTYNNLINVLKDKKNISNLLHKRNIYDLFLWFIIVPMDFYVLALFEENFQNLLYNLSSPLRIGIYIYIFIMFLLIFRITFNYMRWLFPYMAFNIDKNRIRNIHKIVLAILWTLIFSPILSKIINRIFSNS